MIFFTGSLAANLVLCSEGWPPIVPSEVLSFRE
jgi:hypothetical protein